MFLLGVGEVLFLVGMAGLFLVILLVVLYFLIRQEDSRP
jgi:hypothetical protein